MKIEIRIFKTVRHLILIPEPDEYELLEAVFGKAYMDKKVNGVVTSDDSFRPYIRLSK